MNNPSNNKFLINLDSFLDIARLKSIEEEIIYGISKSYIEIGLYGPGMKNKKYKDLFDTKIEMDSTDRFKSNLEKSIYYSIIDKTVWFGNIIYLKRPKNYESIQNPDFCQWTENAKHFSNLIRWIKLLPMKAIGRVVIFLLPPLMPGQMHLDGLTKTNKYEFIWCRPNLEKKFFLYDDETEEKTYVDSYSAYFNTTTQYHGIDPSPFPTFSIRIDGLFEDTFKDDIGLRSLLL